MRYEGKFNNVPIYTDPNAPEGIVYLLNEANMEIHTIDARSRWRRIKDWILKYARKLSKN